MNQVKLKKLPETKKKKKAVDIKLSQPPKDLDLLSLSLPIEENVPPQDMGAYTLLLFGRKKIGKTSTISHFPNTLNLMFDPGSKALRNHHRPINFWEEFLQYIKLLESKKNNFQTVNLDTGKRLYNMCQNYVCRQMGINHPQDAKWGKGWTNVREEMEKVYFRLLRLDLGVIVICHEAIIEIDTVNDESISRVVPDLSKQATEFFNGVINTIAYYKYEGSERVIILEGNEYLEAGTQCVENFRTYVKKGTKCKVCEGTGKIQNANVGMSDNDYLDLKCPDCLGTGEEIGKQVAIIPMGNSSIEGYNNLIKAFHNQQLTTGKEESQRRVKKKVKTKLKKL